MKRVEAVILMGIQGSGKSTFYDQRFAKTHLRISMDLAGTRARERRLMEECIVKRQDYVVDNTNSVASQRKIYIEAAKLAGFRVRGYFFPPDIKEALKRNAAREGKAKVPVPGIFRTLKYFQTPSFEEGFDELWEVHCRGGEFVLNQITD
jgi:predicted kinase